MAIPFGLITSIFGDWKLILLVVAAIGVGTVIWKLESAESKLLKAEAAVKQERENNIVLKGNIMTLSQVNDANQRVIDQQARNAKLTVETLNKLSKELKESGKSFGDIQAKIDAINVKPTALSPYLKTVIDGIQQEREKLNLPLAEPVKTEPVKADAAPAKVEPAKPPPEAKKWVPTKQGEQK